MDLEDVDYVLSHTKGKEKSGTLKQFLIGALRYKLLTKEKLSQIISDRELDVIIPTEQEVSTWKDPQWFSEAREEFRRKLLEVNKGFYSN